MQTKTILIITNLITLGILVAVIFMDSPQPPPPPSPEISKETIIREEFKFRAVFAPLDVGETVIGAENFKGKKVEIAGGPLEIPQGKDLEAILYGGFFPKETGPYGKRFHSRPEFYGKGDLEIIGHGELAKITVHTDTYALAAGEKKEVLVPYGVKIIDPLNPEAMLEVRDTFRFHVVKK